MLAVRGKLHLAASEETKKIRVTDAPLKGAWTEAATIKAGRDDPCLFLDDDVHLHDLPRDGVEPTHVRFRSLTLICSSRSTPPIFRTRAISSGIR
jgi:hypothetical protein